jgi:hypothetical protein
MGWWSLELVPGHEDDVNMVLRSAWAAAYAGASLAYRSVVFRGRGAGSSSILYFTPAAHELADALGAKSCEQPPRAGLELAIGDSRALELWFSDTAAAPAKRPTLHLPASANRPVRERDAQPSAPAPLR